MIDKNHACPNCGAEVKSTDTRCPFCGYINEEGAEKAYMDRLNDLKNDLDVVDEEAAEEYGKGYGKILKLILITLAVLLVISGIVIVRNIVKENKRRASYGNSGDDILEEMTWKKETFAELDRLYEAGDYEKLCDVMYEAFDKHYSVNEWKHYRFASAYNDYLTTVEDFERIDREGFSKYEAGDIFYKCCFFYYHDDVYKYGEIDNKLSEEELEKLKPATEYMIKVLHERLGFSDEDMDSLKDRLVSSYNSLKYDECQKVIEEHMDQIK